MTIEQLVGWSALLAAAATVIGVVFLGLFFSRGQPWGLWNDVASVVLMLATIPVALAIGRLEMERTPTVAVAVAAIGIGGMLVAAGLEGALAAKLRTYEQLLRPTAIAGAVVGVWYVMAGILALPGALPRPMGWVMIASGIGFIALGYGFARGGQRDPIAALGFATLGMGSTVFLTYLGLFLLSGKLEVPAWNA